MTWHVNDGGELFVSLQNVVTIVYTSPVKDINWHHKCARRAGVSRRGDYVAVNASDASSSLVYIHQLSKKHSQIPIAKLKGLVQRVQFSPAAHPYLFGATQTEVKIYNLVKQTLVNKLKTGCKWVSTMAVRLACGSDVDSPLRRQPHRRLVRRASVVVRSGPRLHAVQDAALSQEGNPQRAVPRALPSDEHLLGRWHGACVPRHGVQ